MYKVERDIVVSCRELRFQTLLETSIRAWYRVRCLTLCCLGQTLWWCWPLDYQQAVDGTMNPVGTDVAIWKIILGNHSFSSSRFIWPEKDSGESRCLPSGHKMNFDRSRGCASQTISRPSFCNQRHVGDFNPKRRSQSANWIHQWPLLTLPTLRY